MRGESVVGGERWWEELVMCESIYDDENNVIHEEPEKHDHQTHNPFSHAIDNSFGPRESLTLFALTVCLRACCCLRPIVSQLLPLISARE